MNDGLELSANLAPDAMRVTGTVTLKVGGEVLAVTMTVPAEATPVEPLLPVFHGLANAIVERAETREALAGREISCRAGCGACCRQAVPIAPSEARAVAALVEAMPEPRRSVIKARFAAATAALDAAGIDHGEAQFTAATTQSRLDLGMAYFRAGIACPFLEAESCSIHPDRPLACREYLVTSPAIACTAPTMETIRTVKLSGKVGQALIASEAVLERRGRVLLVDALDWAAANPAPVAEHNGPTLMTAVFDVLAKLSAA